MSADDKQNPYTDPPKAERRTHSSEYHGRELVDNYFWLKDQSYPNVDDEDVLSYLREENAYFESFMAPLKTDVEVLFNELKGRQVENESSVPVRRANFVYQTRYIPGLQYRQHLRWSTQPDESDFNLETPEEYQILIDENALASGKDYFRLQGPVLDQTQQHMVYSIDDSGAERFTLHIQRIADGWNHPETIENVTGEVVWSANSQSFYYVEVNEEWRPFRVLKHTLGTDPSTDTVIYEETDDGFFVGIESSTSDRVLFVNTASHTTGEVRYLWLDSQDTDLTLMSERRENHLYEVDHQQNRFVIRTNDEHINYRLATTQQDNPQEKHWRTLVPGSDERYLTGLIAFQSNLVVSGREHGNDRVFRFNTTTSQLEPLELPESAYSVHFEANPEPDPTFLRLAYSSLITPESVLDYQFSDDSLITRKIQTIPSGYTSSLYETNRLFTTARDGTKVPVTVVHKKSTPLDGTAPLYLYAYGAYGSSTDPYFRTIILSLLDRGFVYAIAHIRGGAELGHAWYEAGKLDQRTNTFYDFIDVARFLIEQQYTSAGQIAIMGGSAGGSLMGVAVNEAPELWGAVAAHVPFVDILNTMLDESLPLTPIEWPEWGNPIEDEEAFDYIQSYSPYDQLKEMTYPPLFVTAGLNDPRVTYWEPAKWVAKIRHLKTDENSLVLRTEMGAGHGGKSGRYEFLREVAEEYAFILNEFSMLK